MKLPLACVVLGLSISVLGCGGEGAGSSATAISEQCCPVARLCAACGCEPRAQTAADEDDTQACLQELPGLDGCLDEVLGSAERTCDANEQRPDTVVETTIVGDWFMCTEDDCTVIGRGTGTRYTADGHVFDLGFPQPVMLGPFQQFSDGDPYCLHHELGTYTYDTVTGELAMTIPGLSEPTISTVFVNGDYNSRGMLRVRENATGTPTMNGNLNCDISNAAPLD